MDSRKQGIEKGQHGGWTIYKHEGIAGLAMPDLTYWFAIKDGERIAEDTKAGLVARIDGLATVNAAHRDIVAAMLIAR
jgi:Cu/Ag efflux protein CusF